MGLVTRSVVLAAAVCSTLLAGVPAGATEPADEVGGHTFVSANMAARTFTTADAVAVARHHDVVLANVHQFREHVAAMRSANPRLRIFVYMNGMFAQRTQGTAYPEAWY